MLSRCLSLLRSRRARRDDPLAILSLDDAIHLVAVIARRVSECIAVVALDDGGALIHVIPVDADPMDVESVTDALLDHTPPVIAAFVLVSVGAPIGVQEASEAALATWRELWPRYDDAGVELLDWFLVEGTHARSMAQTAGYESRW